MSQNVIWDDNEINKKHSGGEGACACTRLVSDSFGFTGTEGENTSGGSDHLTSGITPSSSLLET
ncbi:MAG TPA: hypothetical protein VGO47_08075 [Chlamydiales bacterium]|jgi:hypothetical protein|nr:hypothetical protein [Chlamydiales bacterium]